MSIKNILTSSLVCIAIFLISCNSYRGISIETRQGKHNGKYKYCQWCNPIVKESKIQKLELSAEIPEPAIHLAVEKPRNGFTKNQEIAGTRFAENKMRFASTLPMQRNHLQSVTTHYYGDSSIFKSSEKKETSITQKKLSGWGIAGIVVGFLGLLFLWASIFLFKDVKFM